MRIIAATNCNLWDLVQQKQFREDLYYRLSVLELEIPPLRRRQKDILPLFLNFIAKQDSFLAVELEQMQQKLDCLLCSHSWPGNVREMENFTKTVIASRTPSQSTEDFWLLLEEEIIRRKKRCILTDESVMSAYMHKRLPPSEEIQKIREALMATNGNYTKAAALLGVSRVTLWRKIKANQDEK